MADQLLRPAPARPGLPLLLCSAAALVVVLLAVALGGAAPQAVPAGLPDPGPVPGWALPPVRLLGRGAALLVVGALLLAVLERRAARPLVVGGAAVVWALASSAELLLGLAEVVALPLAQTLQGDLLRYWTTETTQGRGLLATTVLAAVLALAAPVAAGARGALALLLVALAALVPPLLAGHAASADSHRAAQAAVVVHVLAAALWVGGVGALALTRAPAAAARFSPLALGCAVAVGVTGVASAWLRLSGWSALSSGYGGLLLVKTVLLALLVGAGARHRARTLPSLAAGDVRAFRRLALAETGLMAAVVAVAVALSRTPPA